MTGYDLFLSRGDLLTTVDEKTIDNRLASSLVLIGKGVPDFWRANDQNFAWMLENFSAATPPVHPLTGQTWHDNQTDRLALYTGTDWEWVTTQETQADGLFDMLVSATNIDFTRSGSTPIFTVTDRSKEYFPMELLLVMRGATTATHPAVINVSTLVDGDIVSSTSIPTAPNNGFTRLETLSLCPILSFAPASTPYGSGSYGKGPYSGQSEIASTVWINVTTPASGGDLNYDAYLFGFVRDTGLPPEPADGVNEQAMARDSVDAAATYLSLVEEHAAATDDVDATVTRRGYGDGLYGEGFYD